MWKSTLLKVFLAGISSVSLICLPTTALAQHGGGHGGGGGGGGFHGGGGGGGGFGGGFHGGGFGGGGFHGGGGFYAGGGYRGGGGFHGGYGGGGRAGSTYSDGYGRASGYSSSGRGFGARGGWGSQPRQFCFCKVRQQGGQRDVPRSDSRRAMALVRRRARRGRIDTGLERAIGGGFCRPGAMVSDLARAHAVVFTVDVAVSSAGAALGVIPASAGDLAPVGDGVGASPGIPFGIGLPTRIAHGGWTMHGGAITRVGPSLEKINDL